MPSGRRDGFVANHYEVPESPTAAVVAGAGAAVWIAIDLWRPVSSDLRRFDPEVNYKPGGHRPPPGVWTFRGALKAANV
jgi:hypothetical protein